MILIALGANLPADDGTPPSQTCMRAIECLRSLEGLDFVAASAWYRTRPVPADPAQPDYCNGVARFSGLAEPVALLQALHRIEAAFGRSRSVPNAARTLDLDIIDLNGAVRAVESPILPHPRMHERAFVLRPLLDVAPDWVHPVSKLSGRDLLAALSGVTGDDLTRW